MKAEPEAAGDEHGTGVEEGSEAGRETVAADPAERAKEEEDKGEEVAEAVEAGSMMDILTNNVFLCYLAAIMCLCWQRDGLLTWMYAFVEHHRGEVRQGRGV